MGIALRLSGPEFEIVGTYYAAAKREPTRRGDLEVSRTDVFGTNFLDLVRMLARKQQSHVVVVSHGGEDGLHMPITPTSTDYADNAVLTDLVTLVDEYPKFTDKVGLFAEGYSSTEDEVKELVKVCHQVRVHDSNCVAVHVRGCRIGAKVKNLETIRRLFDSTAVSAPECPMLYASFSPMWKPRDQDVFAWMSANKPDTRRRDFVDTPARLSRLVLDVNYAGTKASTQGAIEHADDLTKWANRFYNNTTHGVQRSMPIAALWTSSGYVLPHEDDYVVQLSAARRA